MLSASLLILALGAASVAAHPHFETHEEAAIYHRRHAHVRRHLNEKCGDKIRARRALRAFKRQTEVHPANRRRALEELTARQDNSSTCVLDPEVTQGPYHILGELYRQDVTENQSGIPVTYSVDFVDVETCEPLTNAWVDYWSANATGFYSGYIASSAGAAAGGGGGGAMPSQNASSSMSGIGDAISSSMSGTAGAVSSSMYAAPSGAPSGNGTGGAGDAGMVSAATDNESFLRGIWRTDEEGQLNMTSIIPGWYTGRAVHAHLKVYNSDAGYIATNGTFVANNSRAAQHTGQFFFPQDFLALVATYSPYSNNSLAYANATTNAEDSIFSQENSDGNDAVMDLEYDENNLLAGVIASTVVGVNTSYVSEELAGSYWDGESSYTTIANASTAVATSVASTSTAVAISVLSTSTAVATSLASISTAVAISVASTSTA